jgi:hypothetical protein
LGYQKSLYEAVLIFLVEPINSDLGCGQANHLIEIAARQHEAPLFRRAKTLKAFRNPFSFG